MNIFYLHYVPAICALFHVDRHVVKMILETAQLLFGVWHVVDPNHELYVPTYRLTHKNHPCAKWARASTANYAWLCELGMALCREYTHRYGKTHKCEAYIADLRANVPPLPRVGFTAVAQAMPDEHKDARDPVRAYRRYYALGKAHLHRWKRREPPAWIAATTAAAAARA